MIRLELKIDDGDFLVCKVCELRYYDRENIRSMVVHKICCKCVNRAVEHGEVTFLIQNSFVGNVPLVLGE